MQTASLRARILCWLVPAGLWLAGALCAAQEPAAGDPPPQPGNESPDQPATEARPAATKGRPVVPAGPFDFKYLEGPDGRAVPVPDTVRLAEFLKREAEREAGAGQGPPQVSVSSLAFDGRADDERAFLTAAVVLEITAEDRWVRVPVLMPEATLRTPAIYTGKGLAVSAAWHPEEGYTWWIKGKGTHQLKLSLSIPLRKLAAQRRVQLTLPPTAVSVLKLRVAAPHITANAPEFSNLSFRTIGQETDIEVIGLRNRLDVSWKALPASNGAATPLEVTTSVVATLVDGEAATLEATQLIQSLDQQGTFDQIHVGLPAGSRLLRLEGPELREQKSDPANPNQIVVHLKKPTSGPVELKWTVLSTLPAIGEPFALEGFEVEQARLQTGFLAVVVVGDFQIIRQPDEDKFLQRVDLADLPVTLRQTPATSAYRFLNRLLLRMKLQRVEPFVTVDPAILLHLASDAAELEGGYRLQILRGSITGFRLRWPGWKQQGWTMTEAELPGHIELRTIEEAGDADVIRLEFPEPAKDRIELRFRARRPLPPGAGRTSLTLPVPESYGRVTTPLAVVAADNLEADLRGVEPTLLRPVGVPDPRISVPRDWQTLKRADWRLESPQSELTLGLSVYQRKIQGSTQVDASIGRSAVTVRQTIVYDVAYERLSQLRFAIPDSVPPEQLRFFLQTRTAAKELLTQIAPSNGEFPAEIRATLEDPAIGRFEIEIRYALGRGASSPDVRETMLSIPLVQSNDVAFASTRFSCRDAAGRDAVVEGPGWLRQLDADGMPVWMLAAGPSQVAVRVAHQAGAPHGALVSRALIRTSVDGTSQSWAQYQLAEGISELSVAFPAHLKPVQFWWNRNPIKLPVEPAATSADGSTAWYEIEIPPRAAEGPRLLTIRYLAMSPAPARFSAGHALDVPWLSDDQSPAQVRWQVELSHHQHLFMEPDGFSPEYRWRSGRLFWSREPESSVADLEKWIGAAAGPTEALGAGDGNRYVFGTFGPPPPLVFRAMSQSGIVLIGAGTALFLGLVLVKWPVMRHLLTLLTVAFVVALVGVWYAAPVQVLLQPAALGLLLAIIAAAIDGFVKRRSRPVTVTLTSSSGFMTPASSHPRSPAAAVGSNEFTSVRSPPPAALPLRPLSESGQLSESGKRT